MGQGAFWAVLGVGAGLALIARQAGAQTPPRGDPSADYFDPVYDAPDDPEASADVPGRADVPLAEQLGLDDIDQWAAWPYLPGAEDMAQSNLQAFLYAIRSAEHNAADVASGEDYRTFYGGSRFSDMSDHPVITGEKKGVRLTPAQCRAAGFPGGVCVSTAAGAYQIIRPTWQRVRELYPRLADFSPASQDEAARRILAEIGAERLLRQGRIEEAIARASKQWASLPGSLAGQPTRSLQWVMARFRDGGGFA